MPTVTDVLNCFRKELAPTGCALLHAKDGNEALSIVDSRAPHIAAAVIEMELPVVNRLDLIGRLTSQQPRPKKIIATTSLEYEPLMELAKHMGADAIVRKPEWTNWNLKIHSGSRRFVKGLAGGLL